MNASLVYHSQWGFLLLDHFPFLYPTPTANALLHVHRYHKKLCKQDLSYWILI